ncbi:DNA polymerase III subunit gamma/tau [Fundidesulfovibrio soli]|uniref:DNA polymerase III subunit gamma/tau n=1 Tax=Fundidesulfovibrio soli TaxID=2922716 RepID=UPI001FAE969A|nr:DNA polymerase III subunit gamma/tau [Fundidesulfovibrio soli]
MSAPSLTSKYRPQRFSDVAGQEAIKRILSKASAEDKIAPAYLFSGTRGVGKTTLARVLAKALNCVTAPTAEPCNECSQCRQITAGVSPDVIEIDAATHGNVEEARRLKEDIGYAPLQSRYKVFIIDEAHMLSKAAFNALLKTLEEPPGRVTFILATTEPHKILPTIISRCQHYVFKRLMQPELEAHLVGLLAREDIPYEQGAVSLIARRGAGSVRDSMSLLAQVLAMGGASLREQDVRDILGLAGQDVFLTLMQAFKEQDCLAVSELLRNVLDRGLDIGFFLRELASSWRNLFLLNQAGEKALGSLELSEEEGRQWLGWARDFEARHIHACWQMTLEGQRRVMTSLEPALALELLMLNLAYVPRLLSLEAMSAGACQPARPTGPGGGYGGGPRPATPGAPPQYGAGQQGWRPPQASAPNQAPNSAQTPRPAPQQAPYPAQQPAQYPAPQPGNQAPAGAAPGPSQASSGGPSPAPGPGSQDPPPRAAQATAPDIAPAKRAEERPRGPRTWKAFHEYALHALKNHPPLRVAFGQLAGGSLDAGDRGDVLRLKCKNEFMYGQITGKPESVNVLRGLVHDYFGPDTGLEFDVERTAQRKPTQELRAQVEQSPLFKEAQQTLGAYIIDVQHKS